MARLQHLPHSGAGRTADRLTGATFADVVFFGNSGSEAIECAIKTARRYHHVNGQSERIDVIGFAGSFHGRTYAAVNASGNAAYLDGFGPRLPGFIQLHVDDMAAIEKAIASPTTAALIVEPVQGEGGARALSGEWLANVRKRCTEAGVLLIYDEVQSGMGRTGKLFAHQWFDGCEPDIMAVAKALGGGFPVGACLASAEAAKGMVFGTHGSTYGGNPLAMAAGNAILDVMLEPGFFEGVAAKGERLRGALEQLIPNHDGVFEEVRGLGLMLGLKLKPEVEARAFVAHLRDDHGLLTVSAGENVVRILPPLVIEDSHIAEAIEKLSAGAASYKVPEAAT